MEYHIITILAIVVIYNLWRYYHEDKQPEYCSSTGSEENGETIIKTETKEIKKINSFVHLNVALFLLLFDAIFNTPHI